MGKQDGNPPRSDACFPGGSSPKGERHQGSRRIHPASLWPCSDVYSLRIGPILASGFGFSSAAVVVLAVSLYAVRAADLAFNAGLFPQVTQSPRALRAVLSGSCPSFTSPACWYNASTCKNSPYNASRLSLRKSLMVRKSGVLFAANTRKAMSSWRRWAMRRDDDTPTQ